MTSLKISQETYENDFEKFYVGLPKICDPTTKGGKKTTQKSGSSFTDYILSFHSTYCNSLLVNLAQISQHVSN